MGQLAQQPMLLILEDLHWTDPTTLELLELLIEQAPRASLYLLASCRPAFQSPWSHRSYLSEIVVTRLSPCQVESMAEQVAGGRPLPEDVLQHIVEKTDGVPLFVEEMTKAVLESGYLKDVNGRYELVGPLASLSIPATLQDALMARLDQMSAAKEVAQLGAVIGREFPYDLIQAISSQDDEALQAGLTQLVEVELLYQRGRLPQVSYIFKHALVQDAAYQSLLHGRRRQLHQQVAEVLETEFPHLAETQPELVAHHFTEAECAEPAMAYWLRAGQSAVAHSAYAEAIEHLTRGLQVLRPLSNTESHRRRELDFQLALGAALRLSKGFSSPQAGHAYARAHELCEQVDDAPQLALVLNGLWAFYATRASFQSALEAGEQLLALGARQADVVVQHLAHSRISAVHFFYGEHVRAQAHIDQAIAQYDSRWQEPTYELRYGTIYGTTSHQWSAWNTWVLGYPEQAW